MTRETYGSESTSRALSSIAMSYRVVATIWCAVALILLLALWLKDDDPNAIYARADLHWPAACLFKPDHQLEDQVEYSLAPLLLGRSDASDPDAGKRYAFGAVAKDTNGAFAVDVSKPTIYFGESTAILRGKEYRQLRYQWWHSASSGRASQGFRMTLDAAGHPVIWEILTDDSGARLIFVATPLEEAAREEFGEPLPGRRHAIEAAIEGVPEVVVPRVIGPGPIPMGPFLYLEGPSHSVATLICRCMPSQFDALAGDRQYELRPLSELEAKGLNTSRWSPALLRQDESEESFDDADDPGWLERCLRLPAF